jgi:hypothetical protein
MMTFDIGDGHRRDHYFAFPMYYISAITDFAPPFLSSFVIFIYQITTRLTKNPCIVKKKAAHSLQTIIT